MKNKIIVIQTAFLGDTLLSIPLLKHIRSHFDDVEITFVCRKGYSDLFLNYGLIDKAYEITKGDSNSYKNIIKDLSDSKFDYLISPHQSFRTHLFNLKINAEVKIGYKRAWNYFALDKRVDRPMGYPEALRQLYLLNAVEGFNFDWNYADKFNLDNKSLFKDKVEFKQSLPSLWSMEIPGQKNNNSLNSHVVIAPGSVWPTKMWRKEYFIELCSKLIKQGYKVSLIGSKDEEELCGEVNKECPLANNLSGKFNLSELYQFLQSADLIVSNDSGAMHMASVAGCRIVSVFGPTVLELGYQPWSEKAVVQQVSLGCRPCGLHGHKRCPIGTHDCMKLVKPTNVLDSVITLLNA